MMTSRGVKLAILASRGQLNNTCPPEMINLLNTMKIAGLDIEHMQSFHLMMANYASSTQNDSMFTKHKDELIILLYPEHKNEKEKALEEAQKKLASIPDELRVVVNKKAPIKGEYNMSK